VIMIISRACSVRVTAFSSPTMSLGDATIVCVQPSQVVPTNCHSIDVLSIASMWLAWVSDNAVLVCC
jgi:hypothetical protein